MDSEQRSLTLELWRLRLRRWGALLFGGVGFLLVGYSALSMYQIHEDQGALLVASTTQLTYQEAFTSQIEFQLVLFAIGVVMVGIASR